MDGLQVSDRKSPHLLPAVINFLSLSNRDSYHHLHQKNLDISVLKIYQYLKLCWPSALYCTTSVALYYFELQVLYCNLCCVAEILSLVCVLVKW